MRYLEPDGLAEAVVLAADQALDTHILAGGTALVPLMKSGYLAPERLVAIGRLPGLRGIERDADGVSIGAMTTHAEVAASPAIRSRWPLLAEACGAVGTVRIRNQGTIGGNVVHADPSQDPPPALLVLDATARVAGPLGERRIALSEFFVDFLETRLAPGEILLSLSVPPAPEGSRTRFRKFLPRSQDDYATVAVAGLIRLDEGGRIGEVRIALAGAGPTPMRARAAERLLAGAAPSAAVIRAAAESVEAEVDPIDDARGSAPYKKAMARVWVERTLGELCEVELR